MSEKKLYDTFDKDEREQLLATYQSKMHRDWVVSEFPVRRERKPRGK